MYYKKNILCEKVPAINELKEMLKSNNYIHLKEKSKFMQKILLEQSHNGIKLGNSSNPHSNTPTTWCSNHVFTPNLLCRTLTEVVV